MGDESEVLGHQACEQSEDKADCDRDTYQLEEAQDDPWHEATFADRLPLVVRLEHLPHRLEKHDCDRIIEQTLTKYH